MTDAGPGRARLAVELVLVGLAARRMTNRSRLGRTRSWANDSIVETSQGPANSEPSGAISPREGCPGVLSVMCLSGDACMTSSESFLIKLY